MKILKIIATYGGNRRQMNNNLLTPTDCINFLKLQVENEINLDPGCDMDVLIVNNDNGNIDFNNYIQSLNDTKIHSGVIKTHLRANLGGSFGAFSEGFDLYENEYDYFLFNEDDIMIFEPSYMDNILDVFDKDNKVGFVSLSPLSYTIPIHSGGAFGVAKKEALIGVKKAHGRLPYIADTSYESFQRSEIDFTSTITALGYYMTTVPQYSTLASNYLKHESQNNSHYITGDNLSKKFIYKVGV